MTDLRYCLACGWDYAKGPHSCPPGTPRLTRLETIQKRIDLGCPKCGREWSYEDLKNQMPAKGSMCLKCWEDPDESVAVGDFQYPTVFTSQGQVEEGSLKLFIDTYMQEHFPGSFEELAESWWAKRLRDKQWQDEQDRLEEVFNNPIARVGKNFVEMYPPQGYIKSSAPQRQRTWVWEMDELRHRHVWKEVHI